jgi:hypothetical protein
LLDEARIWLNLDLAWENLDFLLAAPAFQSSLMTFDTAGGAIEADLKCFDYEGGAIE